MVLFLFLLQLALFLQVVFGFFLLFLAALITFTTIAHDSLLSGMSTLLRLQKFPAQ